MDDALNSILVKRPEEKVKVLVKKPYFGRVPAQRFFNMSACNWAADKVYYSVRSRNRGLSDSEALRAVFRA